MSFRGIFITISALVVVLLIGGGIFVWYEARTAKGLGITLEVPEKVQIGVPFDLEAQVANDSQSILDDVELSIELPAGVAFLGSASDKLFYSKSLGNLGEGSLAQDKIPLIVLEGENTVKEIKAVVSYLPASIDSRFEKDSSVELTVGESSMKLDLTMPEKVFSGESFEVRVSYENTSETDFSDLRFTAHYPPAFKFGSSSLKPDTGNNRWEFGDLRSGSTGELSIKGQLIGPDNAFFEFPISLEATFLGRSYTIAEKSATIAIAPSPLSFAISLNDGAGSSVHLGDDLDYELSFINNTDVGLKDVIIQAQIIGQMFDISTLSSTASLRASDNTLVWNAANTPSLALLEPNTSGSVSFRLRAKSAYPIKKLSDKNFVLKVDAEIESPTVPYSVSAEKTVSVAKMETKVAGDIKVDAKGFFRDASAGILNNGPWPPKVGQPTQFTIHWLVTNFATDAKSITVKAFLGGNVRFTGAAKATGGSVPVYNDRTQEMVWTIDNIAAGKGVLNAPLEAIFQVEATPSVAFIGSPIQLMQATVLTATDDFTGESLSAGDKEVKTTELDDLTVNASDGKVTP